MPWTQKQQTEYRKKWLARQTPEKQEQMREENKARCKKWHAEHPEQAKKTARECNQRYYQLHREEVLAKQREYYRKKHPKK